MNNNDITSTNISFNALRNSPEFLNVILNKITNAVLLLNKDMELQAFNDPFKTIFSNKKDEDLLYVRCGEAIGCAYSVEEMKNCGETSRCSSCSLRINALESYITKKPIYKKKISREFYTQKGKKELKNLQFSVIPFYFNSDYYIIMLVEYVTELVNLKNKLNKN